MPDACGACGSRRTSAIYRQSGVPVHSVLNIRTREEAVNFPRGELRLHSCQDCGYVFNAAFDPSLLRYSADYEETQGFSGTFNEFHRELADRLIERYSLRGKRIVEIGCGKGEFLHLLCERGGNRGIGFDPAYVPSRDGHAANGLVEFIADFYSPRHAADFVCCKMTLEHIHNPREFVATVRQAIPGGLKTIVYFQVPDAGRVLRDGAFWDVYYEHCGYHTARSLTTLFHSNGFAVTGIESLYDGQYVAVEACPTSSAAGIFPPEEDMKIEEFAVQTSRRIEAWRRWMRAARELDRRVVLWGAGSKGVAFLHALGADDAVECCVDINPFRQGHYMAGSGQRIISPGQLKLSPPDAVVVMNPIYIPEIQRALARLGLAPEILPIDRA